MLDLLEEKIQTFQPNSVAFSVPFTRQSYGRHSMWSILKKALIRRLRFWNGLEDNPTPHSDLEKEARAFLIMWITCFGDGEAPIRLLLVII